MDIVLQAIGNEQVNGFAKPIDVLILQEQAGSATSGHAFADLLNEIHDTTAYVPASLDAGTLGAGRSGLVYNSDSVELIQQVQFGSLGGSAKRDEHLAINCAQLAMQAMPISISIRITTNRG